MDFVVGLLKTLGKFDSIWVIVDRLTKSTHFLPIQMTYNAKRSAKLYVKEVIRLHGCRFRLFQIGVHTSPFISRGPCRQN